MTDAQFPTRTAGDLTLPNGDTVWVCQLNTLLSEEVHQKASWHAQSQARTYLKDGRDYPDVLAYIKAMTPEQQAGLIAQQEYWAIKTESEQKHPVPEKPEQGEKKPEEFAQAVIVWEADCKKADEKRKKMQQVRWDAEIKKNLALLAKNRIERACIAFFAEKYSEAYVKAREIETMHRAVRHADDHTKRYFSTPAAYEDADDSVQAAIREFFYETLAEPRSAEIPILPVAS